MRPEIERLFTRAAMERIPAARESLIRAIGLQVYNEVDSMTAICLEALKVAVAGHIAEMISTSTTRPEAATQVGNYFKEQSWVLDEIGSDYINNQFKTIWERTHTT